MKCLTSLMALLILLYLPTLQAASTQEEMAIQDNTDQVNDALAPCREKYPGKSFQDRDLGACSIHALYPLAEQGNYLAAYTIAGTYFGLGYMDETQKWLEYTLSMDNVPKDIINKVNMRLQGLSKK